MKELWLSRNKEDSRHYILWASKPEKDIFGDGDYFVYGQNELEILCTEHFHALTTGVRLRPGGCVEIKEIRFVSKKVKK